MQTCSRPAWPARTASCAAETRAAGAPAFTSAALISSLPSARAQRAPQACSSAPAWPARTASCAAATRAAGAEACTSAAFLASLPAARARAQRAPPQACSRAPTWRRRTALRTASTASLAAILPCLATAGAPPTAAVPSQVAALLAWTPRAPGHPPAWRLVLAQGQLPQTTACTVPTRLQAAAEQGARQGAVRLPPRERLRQGEAGQQVAQGHRGDASTT